VVGKVDSVGRQNPDAMKMAGHDDPAIGLEWTQWANGSEGHAQAIDGLNLSDNRTAAICHRVKKKVPPRKWARQY